MIQEKLIPLLQILHLEAGDIIVCKDEEVAEQVYDSGLTLPFTVPIIIAPEGVAKLDRSDLVAALAVVDSIRLASTRQEWEGFDA